MIDLIVTPVWRKSIQSVSNGNDCAPTWRKSTRSTPNGNDCVEIATVRRS